VREEILVVDDEEGIRRSVSDILNDEGFKTTTASDGDEALAAIAKRRPQLVMLDVAMPGRDGLQTLARLRESWPDLPVIMMSGHGTVETAVHATKLGAYDFLEKPLSYDKILLCVRHCLESARLEERNAQLRSELLRQHELIGESGVMRELKEQIGVAAPTEGWVLITGENGTGKEVVATGLHLLSRRADFPFVEVNCAAIPEELIESELFGHERGAFTGALQTRRGKFEVADGGTIFLDEIGDMSLMTQAKILRILQEHRFERVGGAETLEVNVRVIAATNKDLEKEMAEGRFREDLYYRLNVIPFHVPALRDRAEDIPLLVDHFLARFAAESGKSRVSLTPRALERMVAYAWPGNVRELQNIVERLVLMTPRDRIDVDDLPAQIAAPGREKLLSGLGSHKLADARAAFEREFLAQKLRDHGGNISRTAEAVGLARETLSRKLRALGVQVEKPRNGR
jgi:two-component system nitrogen regulation response regulator NtrX